MSHPQRPLVSSIFKIALVTLFLLSVVSAQSTYTITDLGTLGGTYSSGNGINASGQVTGRSSTPVIGSDHAFLYSAGTMSDLGTLGGSISYGLGINASGQVTGTSFTTGSSFPSPYHAFLYSAGTMTDLGTLGGTYSSGNGINATGQITGYASTTGNSVFHAFVYSPGTMTDLGTLGGSNSEGDSINDTGQVTGASNPPNSNDYHAFLYSAGTMTDLGTLGGRNSYGLGINASGQVTGRSSTPVIGVEHAFLYSAGTMIDLGTLGGSDSQGFGVNASGQVVGKAFTTSDVHAFLYTPGTGMEDLNTLVPSGSGWTLNAAFAINDAGQIAAIGFNPAGAYHALLLSPQPPTIDTLITMVNSFGLDKGIANSLLAKLSAAKSAGSGSASCSDLNDFISQIQSQSGKKLSTQQANQLITTANQVKSGGGCE